MKQLTFRLGVAVCTFVVGVSATAIWLHGFSPNAQALPPRIEIAVPVAPASQTTDDKPIPSVKLCELVKESPRFIGKVVRLEAFYDQGVDTAALNDSGCDEWLRPSCAAGDESCEKIWNRIVKADLAATSGVRVDVVGKYNSDA